MTSQARLISEAVERNGGVLYAVACVQGWDALMINTGGYITRVSAQSAAVTEQGVIGFLAVFGDREQARTYADEYCNGAAVFTLNDGRQLTDEATT